MKFENALEIGLKSYAHQLGVKIKRRYRVKINFTSENTDTISNRFSENFMYLAKLTD